jgi:hypothetical protein
MHGLAAATGTGAIGGTGITGGDIFGLFNIFVGLMVVGAIIAFVAGLIVWTVRLGTVGRSEGIRIMEWGVVVLFVVVVLLAIVQYFTTHPAAVTILIAIVVALFIGYIVLEVIRGSGGDKEEH